MYTGYYRLSGDGLNTNPVRCVYVSCGKNNMCSFKSSTTRIELSIATTNKTLHSDDNCVVNFVEIIHDCIPRRVDLNLSFTSRTRDTNLYLQVCMYIYVYECQYASHYNSIVTS